MSDNNVRYVVFDLESRDVKGIFRNQPGIGETYFESTYEELEDFITGEKNSANYYVEKENQQSKYSLKIKKTNIAINLLDDRLYKIPKKHFGEIVVTNFRNTKTLRIQIENNFRNYLKNKYKVFLMVYMFAKVFVVLLKIAYLLYNIWIFVVLLFSKYHYHY